MLSILYDKPGIVLYTMINLKLESYLKNNVSQLMSVHTMF